MEKYFTNHNQCVALKELGYNEPCLASWNFYTNEFNYNPYPSTFRSDDVIQLPLKSQVFEWFRKNHLLGHDINCPFVSYSGKNAEIRNGGRYELYITDEEQLSLPEDIFYSTDYFEAESKAIDKLIEIVKNK